MEEIKISTVYVGHDGVTYDARANLEINDDGSFSISRYDYFVNGNWKNTEERDWDDHSVEDTFEVTIVNGRIVNSLYDVLHF